MFASIGFGLLCGSLVSLISSFSYFSLSNSFISACKSLNLSSGDALPIVNATFENQWGTRMLVGLPVGLSSTKVMDQQRAIAEALRVTPDNMEMRYDDGLIIDIIKKEMPIKVPYREGFGYKVFIGVNKRGEERFYDFDGPFPHLLIGGISGGGKSVMLRAILTQLVFGPAPDLFLCDLKGGVELGLYRELECVKGLAITLQQCRDAAAAVEEEMNRRYSVMFSNGSQSWEGRKMVFVMDELADLKTRAGDPEAKLKQEIKTILTRISAKGRAAGVLLVLCTQRPSADVVDGLIKTNIAASICFRTRDDTQSRIVLDHNGAAELPDIPGRLIFQSARDETLQAPFISAGDAKQIISKLPKRILELEAEQHEHGSSQTDPLDGNFIELR
ncbi:FtsK/SpoIIIE domain-containing protein [Paenibacillus chibensis]|uniref:FtsK/SpoIIIE domain-containing protein n=1 Tax=Paenibacillus chibensis TaxID=59846 RepID=A0ABU6PNF2_9BACL|nr:FtsK/SpoIIIE domain-containing protein [Paenibacillus chibensis]